MKCYKNRWVSYLCVAGIIVGSFGLSACGNGSYNDVGSNIVENPREESKAEASVFAMDTFMTITAYGAQAEEAVQAAQKEIEYLDQLLSAGSSESEVGKLNQNGAGMCSADTAYLLERSLKLYNETDGAFDVMMYPLMENWGFISGEYKVPSQETIDKLLPLADVSKVSYDPEQREVQFLENGMKVDFGGIAKGYTSSCIMDIFDQYDISSGIVNLGGNVQVKGKKTDGTDWRVGIRDPKGEKEYLGILSISDKAVITSGGYERFFEENGVRYHHILDPKTGKPAQSGLDSVTIVSEDGTLADGLSTALFVMGVDKAQQYWMEHSNDFDAILVTDDGTIYVTEGLEHKFESKIGKAHIIRQKNK